MNRREALAALVSLPEIGRISVAKVQPNDVIVIETPNPLSDEQTKNITDFTKQIWPDHKVIVLADGLTMKFISEVCL